MAHTEDRRQLTRGEEPRAVCSPPRPAQWLGDAGRRESLERGGKASRERVAEHGGGRPANGKLGTTAVQGSGSEVPRPHLPVEQQRGDRRASALDDAGLPLLTFALVPVAPARRLGAHAPARVAVCVPCSLGDA